VTTKLLDFLFPPRCPICGESVSKHGQICAVCWNRFDWITDPKCARCGYPFPANIENDGKMLCPNCIAKKTKLDWMRSACVYDDASRNIMLPFKHGAQLQFCDVMSRAMCNSLRELQLQNDTTTELLVMPVPLATRRLWKRGYNQAALLARPIAKILNAKIDYNSVRRKHRADMGHKNARQRAENIRGVFIVRNPDKIKGRTILLVDDVFTTGATFNELAKILKKAGASWVGGVTFCRVVRAI
jgi:ComF family protein